MQPMYIQAQLLLGVAMIGSIAAVGCVFELSSGEPDWGVNTTWAILLGSIPVTLISFITAVKLARTSMKG